VGAARSGRAQNVAEELRNAGNLVPAAVIAPVIAAQTDSTGSRNAYLKTSTRPRRPDDRTDHVWPPRRKAEQAGLRPVGDYHQRGEASSRITSKPSSVRPVRILKDAVKRRASRISPRVRKAIDPANPKRRIPKLRSGLEVSMRRKCVGSRDDIATVEMRGDDGFREVRRASRGSEAESSRWVGAELTTASAAPPPASAARILASHGTQ